MPPLTLRTAIASYPHAVALKDGSVASDRLRLDFEDVQPVTRAFRRMVRTLDFDLCEIALTTLAQAHACSKPIVGLPVVLMRGFHHGALVCRRDSPIRGPQDLPGKRVGVRAYSQTTGVWVRGILQSDYGVHPDSITWITAEDAHVLEYHDPPNTQRLAPGHDLAAMLMSGEIDAGIALTGLDPAQIRTVIPDADTRAAAWFARTGIYPVNHVVCVRRVLLDRHDWLAAELMDLFRAAKRAARAPSAEQRWQGIVGDDVLPYGLAANRRAIALCLDFAAQQGLIPRAWRPEELFSAALT
ncbi:MAG TPA: ABC transporter substrate-binding protein [Acetobacteraceae bacterium]|nr:ABC transporter substrate-binding protein [Acetobacteraceae bacterium]